MMQRFSTAAHSFLCADGVINLTEPVEERRTFKLKLLVLLQPLRLLSPMSQGSTLSYILTKHRLPMSNKLRLLPINIRM